MEIYVVNVFAASENGGNVCAVIINYHGDEQGMQELAEQLNLPETIFVLKNQFGETVLRFFAVKKELPMCGHGLIGTSKVLDSLGRAFPVCANTVGGLEVNLFKVGEGRYSFEKQRGSVISKRMPPSEVAKLLHVSTEMICPNLPCCVATIGSPKLLVPILSRDALTKIEPDNQKLKQWSAQNQVNGIYAYSIDTIDPSCTFHARNFNPLASDLEDAATGVGAGALIEAASANPTLATKLDISYHKISGSVEQGYHLSRPSCIHISLFPEKITINGYASITHTQDPKILLTSIQRSRYSSVHSRSSNNLAFLWRYRNSDNELRDRFDRTYGMIPSL